MSDWSSTLISDVTTWGSHVRWLQTCILTHAIDSLSLGPAPTGLRDEGLSGFVHPQSRGPVHSTVAGDLGQFPYLSTVNLGFSELRERRQSRVEHFVMLERGADGVL